MLPHAETSPRFYAGCPVRLTRPQQVSSSLGGDPLTVHTGRRGMIVGERAGRYEVIVGGRRLLLTPADMEVEGQ